MSRYVATDSPPLSAAKLMGGHKMLIIGMGHRDPETGPMIAAQLDQLEIRTLYIEMADTPEVRDLLSQPRMPVGELARATRNHGWELDLVVAARSLGIRVVPIDNVSALVKLIDDHGPDSEKPLPADRLFQETRRKAANRTDDMARAVVEDQVDLIERSEIGDPGRSLSVVGQYHLTPAALVDGHAVNGLGVQLSDCGIDAVCVRQAGAFIPIEAQFPGMQVPTENRSKWFVTGTETDFIIHYPERPLSFEVFDLLHPFNGSADRLSVDEVRRIFLEALPGDAARARYLTGCVAVSRGQVREGIAEFHEAGKSDPLYLLAEARERSILATTDSTESNRDQHSRNSQRNLVLEALREATRRGVVGAARIAAGHLRELGLSDEAREMDQVATSETHLRQNPGTGVAARLQSVDEARSGPIERQLTNAKDGPGDAQSQTRGISNTRGSFRPDL